MTSEIEQDYIAMQAAEPDRGTVRASDEPLPFLSNFQDWFLSLGVIVLLFGLVTGAVSIGTEIYRDGEPFAVIGLVTTPILLVVAGLSHVLVGKRRRVLPGIVLSLAFLAVSGALFTSLYAGLFAEGLFDAEIWDGFDAVADDYDPSSQQSLRAVAQEVSAATPFAVKAFLIGLPLTLFAAALGYYRAYKLPFASALTGATGLTALLALLFVLFPYDVVRFHPALTLAFGLALLAGGVAYDMRDPERVMRWSGNGFWLHLFAAPVLLNGALTIAQHGLAYDMVALAEGDFDYEDQFGTLRSIVTLLVIFLFGVISLLLNRRALVVSGLVSAGISIAALLNIAGLGVAGVSAITLIVLGGGVLLLGVGWHGARMALLRFLPEGGAWGRIFPRVDTDG